MIIILLVVLLTICPFSNSSSTNSYSEIYYFSNNQIDTKYIEKIIINNPLGKIQIIGWDKNILDIRSKQRICYPDTLDSLAMDFLFQQLIIQHPNNSELTIDSKLPAQKDEFHYSISDTTNGTSQIFVDDKIIYVTPDKALSKTHYQNDITMFIRTNIDIAVNSKVGEVLVRNISGNIDIGNSCGKVNIWNCNGTIFVDDFKGGVMLDEVNGNVKIKSSSGSVYMNSIDSKRINLSSSLFIETGSGNITVYSDTLDLNTITLNSSKGNINVNFSCCDRINYHIETMNGNVYFDSKNFSKTSKLIYSKHPDQNAIPFNCRSYDGNIMVTTNENVPLNEITTESEILNRDTFFVVEDSIIKIEDVYIGQIYHLQEGRITSNDNIHGALIDIYQDMTIAGKINGNLYVIQGKCSLTSEAVIDGNVILINSELDRGKNATILGDIIRKTIDTAISEVVLIEIPFQTKNKIFDNKYKKIHRFKELRKRHQ